MSYNFELPDIGEGISEGEILNWLVSEGEKVEQDQDIVKIETDKAIANIPSPIDGKVEALKATEDEIVEVGSVIAKLKETTSEETNTEEQELKENHNDSRSSVRKSQEDEHERDNSMEKPSNKNDTNDDDLIGNDVFEDDGEGYAIQPGEEIEDEEEDETDSYEQEENQKEEVTEKKSRR